MAGAAGPGELRDPDDPEEAGASDCDGHGDSDRYRDLEDADEPGESGEPGTREAERWHDQQTLCDLARESFEGPTYEVFKTALISYGIPVVESWLLRGLIWPYCASRGRPVTPLPAERSYLSDPTSPEAAKDREDLAVETNIRALRSFRENVLLPGAWSFEGGASLRTYFVGAGQLEFPNTFSLWATERRHRRFDTVEPSDMTDVDEGATDLGARGAGLDPAVNVVAELTVAAELAAMPVRTREAGARLILFDASQAEIAAELGVSERAVEGMLYRYRRTVSRVDLTRRIQ